MNNFSMPSMQEMQSLIDFCKVMASSPFYQKLGPGGVMAIYLTAKEYDLPFMACLNGGLHTFDGKVTFSAIMIDALILKAGHKTQVVHLDEKSCTIRFTRGDRKNDPDYKPFDFTYDLRKAQVAGYLGKNNWKSSPTDMLYSRCLTGGGRKHMPEVFVGVLVAGELVGDNRDSNIEPLIPASVHVTSLEIEKDREKIAENLQISHEKSPKWDEFCKTYEIVEGSLAEKYINQIAENSSPKRSYVETVNAAIENEDKFVKAFEKWKVPASRKEVLAESRTEKEGNPL